MASVMNTRRKGQNVAGVATARKIATLIWTLLSQEEPYRWARPAFVAMKMRKLDLRAGVPKAQTRQLELGPGPERFDLGQAVGLPRGAADIGGLARDVALDVVERADPVQRLARDL